MCFEGLARLSRRVWRRFVRGSREISLVSSLHRASTDALISTFSIMAYTLTILIVEDKKMNVAKARISDSLVIDVVCVFLSIAPNGFERHFTVR